jgi:hypothetical protein
MYTLASMRPDVFLVAAIVVVAALLVTLAVVAVVGGVR